MSKRMRWWIGVPLAVAVVGGIGLFAAHGQADERDGDFPFWGFWRENIMERMDANKDGNLGSAEIQQFEATRAAEIDANKDGTITAEELQAWFEKQRMQRLAEYLTRMDGNGDGKVSVDEYETVQTWRLARLDRDGDGVLETRELGRGGEWMHRHP